MSVNEKDIQSRNWQNWDLIIFAKDKNVYMFFWIVITFWFSYVGICLSIYSLRT